MYLQTIQQAYQASTEKQRLCFDFTETISVEPHRALGASSARDGSAADVLGPGLSQHRREQRPQLLDPVTSS
jgi:hypothetical protein